MREYLPKVVLRYKKCTKTARKDEALKKTARKKTMEGNFFHPRFSRLLLASYATGVHVCLFACRRTA
jgi:hypothetical protein